MIAVKVMLIVLCALAILLGLLAAFGKIMDWYKKRLERRLTKLEKRTEELTQALERVKVLRARAEEYPVEIGRCIREVNRLQREQKEEEEKGDLARLIGDTDEAWRSYVRSVALIEEAEGYLSTAMEKMKQWDADSEEVERLCAKKEEK